MNQVGLPRSFQQLPQVGQDAQRNVRAPVVLPQVGPDQAMIPRALDSWVVTVGGIAIIAVTGPINGGFITNPVNAAAQGIPAAENVYIDMVAVPGATDALASGTTVILQPGQNFTLPWLALGVQVGVNATSSGHKISGEVW